MDKQQTNGETLLQDAFTNNSKAVLHNPKGTKTFGAGVHDLQLAVNVLRGHKTLKNLLELHYNRLHETTEYQRKQELLNNFGWDAGIRRGMANAIITQVAVNEVLHDAIVGDEATRILRSHGTLSALNPFHPPSPVQYIQNKWEIWRQRNADDTHDLETLKAQQDAATLFRSDDDPLDLLLRRKSKTERQPS